MIECLKHNKIYTNNHSYFYDNIFKVKITIFYLNIFNCEYKQSLIFFYHIV